MRGIVALLFALALGGVAPVGAGAQEMATADGELLNRADSVRIRLAAAPAVILMEFVDFACSDCAAFHMARADSLQALVAAEDLVYAFRVYPIPRLLRGYHGAEAAFCAGGVGGRAAFEAMTKLLFQRQGDWALAFDPQPLILAYARELGLPGTFDECVRRNAVSPLILADARQGAHLGVPGTPTFVVLQVGEDEPVDLFYGNQPMERFREAIARARTGS
jgi:protein-disulfide isomerase